MLTRNLGRLAARRPRWARNKPDESEPPRSRPDEQRVIR
jgi:hypothetical protein